MPGSNLPAYWRLQQVDTFQFPLTQVTSVHGTRAVTRELKKYINGGADFLARLLVRVSGNIVIAGAGPGAATGLDNPTQLLVSAGLVTSPVFANAIPLNLVSSRALRTDAMLNGGWLDSYTVVADGAGTVAIDQVYELNFKRSESEALEGVDYDLAIAKYTSAVLTLVFGGRDQLFTGGTNTWDLSGLTVQIFADIDMGIDPQFIHAHELFEIVVPVSASNSQLKIDSLPPGFVYTDLLVLTESNNALADGILNNLSISSGAQTWLNKGEGNAAVLRYSMLKRNNRSLTTPATLTGLYALPMRDGMFTRAYDARFAQLVITADVNVVGTTQLRIVGRRMIPGGVYARPRKAAH